MQQNLAKATGIITIDLGAIAANWKALAARVAPAECAAVVKADAYGLGAARVIPALVKAGCKTLFVATPSEAEAARKLAPKATIYILYGLIDACAADYVRLDVRPVLSMYDDIRTWLDVCTKRGIRPPAGLHIDSGLNRLGLPAADTRKLAGDTTLTSGLNLSLVMSHLASADNPRDPKNREQLVAFETLSNLFARIPRSLAASDGLMLGSLFHFDLVRPGYALYGGQASRDKPAPVKSVVTVVARVLAVNDVLEGGSVGYGATWRAGRRSRIAVISAGYADGLPRGASAATGGNGGHVMFGSFKAPVVGRVSMDLTTVDITDLPVGAVKPGDFARLTGDGLTLEDAGSGAGTIGYEILTRLGPRFQRLYLEDELG